MSEPEKSVLVEVREGVALVTLHRPSRMNALTAAMTSEYFEALDACAGDPRVRAIVITGSGRGFCVGSDVAHLEAVRADSAAASISVGARSFASTTALPKPVIAAINGACAGLGLVIALSCDVRFVAADAKLTTAFVRRGVIAEQGVSWLLTRTAGASAAMDLLLSGRVVTGEDAATLGVVDHVVRDGTVVEAAFEYAAEMARFCSPSSMAQIKAQILRDATRTLDESVDDSRALLRTAIESPDFAEGVASYVERRSPRFAGLAPAKH